MRATLMYGAGDVRVETIPDPTIQLPTDAIVRVVLACICGSDLHPWRSMPHGDAAAMGHEFLGVVEELGSDVRGLKTGDLVVAPFATADNTCEFCREGLHTACPNGNFFGYGPGAAGTQAELVRVPQAQGSLLRLPVGVDSALLPSLLTLSDVFGTGHHAAFKAGVTAGQTVAVVGDGAVGLLAVMSAKRLGAERIILMGRHQARTDIGREFGATDVIAERGEEGVAKLKDLTRGQGSHAVLEAVGSQESYDFSLDLVRAGGVVSRVGLPSYDAPIGVRVFGPNITVTGGPAPVRAYMEELLPDILDGTLQPGKVFDRTVTLDDVATGYQAMDDRTALKVLVRP
ncbi:alcohol dehydrogenase catalytic domain-containing protein [Curtobacterium flaccumfaciens]|uniref:alcohol dehydrogenase catalytic domain-containing protein n=1 Tax=Curtobacterium flaccumfaciens TaxID=2035 RepID=UPI0034285687